MLSDEQRAELAKAMIGRTVTQSEQEVSRMVEQWISEAVTDALESGNLPDGWERREEARAMQAYRVDAGTLANPTPPRYFRRDGSEIDASTWPRRTVITGPWREVEQP